MEVEILDRTDLIIRHKGSETQAGKSIRVCTERAKNRLQPTTVFS